MLNIVLILLIIVGLVLYYFFMREFKKKKWYLVPGLFSLLIVISSILMLIGINVQQNGMITIDGGIKGSAEMLESPNSSNDLNLVYVSQIPVKNLAQRVYLELSLREENPTFTNYENSVVSGNEYGDMSRSLLEESMSKAYLAAYREAGVPIPYDKHIKVETLYDNPLIKTDSTLKKEDIIQRVNGKEINNRSQLWVYANEESELQLDVVSSDKMKSISLSLNEYGKSYTKTGFWVSEGLDYDLPNDAPELKTDFLDSGDSAGLLMAMKLFYEVTGEEINEDLKVVVTGAISEDGKVGPVGDVGHKVTTAIKAGADVFIVPEDNALDALFQQQQIKNKDMEIVVVKTLKEALDYLKNK